MLIEVKVPVLSESISEATLVAWHKHAGEFVEKDENLVDLETDKVILEVVAPKGGILKEIKKSDGVIVLSDEVIAVIDTDGIQQIDVSANDESNVLQMKQQEKNKSDGLVTLRNVNQPVDKYNHGPAVEKLVVENNIDTSKITGTGKDDRITKGDILKQMENHSPKPAMDNYNQVPENKKLNIPLALNTHDGREEKRVPMSRLRMRVAERLKDVQNTAAILTTFNEVNMQPVMDLREKYKKEFMQRHDTKLGFMSFFTKASVEALKQYPIVNSSIDDNDIVYHGYYDIGIAIGSPRGLVVPILRDVDRMGFADIENAIASYGKKAKDGKLTLDDLSGGTFSISNGGVYGSMLSTPILNPPQSAILGMHNIQPRAMVENNELVIRPMMYVALSYDHRIIDGQDAVTFLIAIKKALEDPVRLLLDV